MKQERRKPDIELIRIAAKEVTNNLLETMGFDMEHPHNIQKDVKHLRRSRELCELIQNKAVATIVGMLILATVGAAWAGFSMALEKQALENKVTFSGRG